MRERRCLLNSLKTAMEREAGSDRERPRATEGRRERRSAACLSLRVVRPSVHPLSISAPLSFRFDPHLLRVTAQPAAWRSALPLRGAVLDRRGVRGSPSRPALGAHVHRVGWWAVAPGVGRAAGRSCRGRERRSWDVNLPRSAAERDTKKGKKWGGGGGQDKMPCTCAQHVAAPGRNEDGGEATVAKRRGLAARATQASGASCARRQVCAHRICSHMLGRVVMGYARVLRSSRLGTDMLPGAPHRALGLVGLRGSWSWFCSPPGEGSSRHLAKKQGRLPDRDPNHEREREGERETEKAR